MDKAEKQKNGRRYGYLDALRGITLVSMIAYHTVWDLVYIAGFEWKWFASGAACIWQQSICQTFILLSGFCWSLGSRRAYRGAVVFAAGMAVSAVTWIFTYESRVTFGVLTFLGTAMLLLIPLEKVLRYLPAMAGLAVSMLLFLFTRGINDGFLGIYAPGKDGMEALKLCRLPESLYGGGYALTFLGFTDRTFYSSDYFSLFPWIFLFLAGYFLYRWAAGKNILSKIAVHTGRLPFERAGRHSLFIYLLHQPVIYVSLMLLGLIRT